MKSVKTKSPIRRSSASARKSYVDWYLHLELLLKVLFAIYPKILFWRQNVTSALKYRYPQLSQLCQTAAPPPSPLLVAALTASQLFSNCP